MLGRAGTVMLRASLIKILVRSGDMVLGTHTAKARHEESMLLLSELVTNVVHHVRPSTTFTIELILFQLKLRVSQRARQLADARRARPEPGRRPRPVAGHRDGRPLGQRETRHRQTGLVRAQPMTPPAAAVRYPGPGPDNITSGSALDALLLLHPGPTSPAAELKALRQGDHALSEALDRPPLPHSVGRHGRRRPGLTSRSHLPEASR
jgi:hypothetical protein